MGAAYFYHLTHRPLAEALRQLLLRSLDAGWQVAVRGANERRLAQLDQALWQGEGFLPHGLAGGPHDGDQPVLLTLSVAAANQPACVISVDGADIAPDEVTALQRACILFDGNSGPGLDKARSQWRALTGAGVSAQYWAEDNGKWQMKAEA